MCHIGFKIDQKRNVVLNEQQTELQLICISELLLIVIPS